MAGAVRHVFEWLVIAGAGGGGSFHGGLLGGTP